MKLTLNFDIKTINSYPELRLSSFCYDYLDLVVLVSKQESNLRKSSFE